MLCCATRKCKKLTFYYTVMSIKQIYLFNMFMPFTFYPGLHSEKCTCAASHGFRFDYVWIDRKHRLVFSVTIEYP